MRPILATLVLWLSIMSLVPARQAAAATVTPELPAYTIAPDVITTVIVRLEDATNVYGIDIRAAFDPALVEVVDADVAADGIQMEPGQFPQPDFVALNRVDPQAGTLRYVVTQVNPTPPANGDGVVFAVRLRGLGVTGAGEFRIDLVEMSDRDGQLLPVQWGAAALEVQGSPGLDQEAEPTGVALAPTSPSAASDTRANAGGATPLPATDQPPAVAAGVLATSTQLPTAPVSTPIAMTAVPETFLRAQRRTTARLRLRKVRPTRMQRRLRLLKWRVILPQLNRKF